MCICYEFDGLGNVTLLGNVSSERNVTERAHWSQPSSLPQPQCPSAICSQTQLEKKQQEGGAIPTGEKKTEKEKATTMYSVSINKGGLVESM